MAKAKKVSVTYTLNKTINLGNFESVKVGASMSIEQDGGNAEELFEEAKEFVEHKVEEQEYSHKV